MTQETLTSNARRLANVRKVEEALRRVKLVEDKLRHVVATAPAALAELERARKEIEGVLGGATEGDEDGKAHADDR